MANVEAGPLLAWACLPPRSTPSGAGRWPADADSAL